MNKQCFELRSIRKGEHIHTTVFSGIEGQTLANTGTLVQSIGEWQLFGALLGLGAKNSQAAQHAIVVFEGDKEIVESTIDK